ncbi:hypothetical protein OC845_002745 [Tilletia horrida]|nr:hypothetical protein OC845_002745 [Tilletia horrida]
MAPRGMAKDGWKGTWGKEMRLTEAQRHLNDRARKEDEEDAKDGEAGAGRTLRSNRADDIIRVGRNCALDPRLRSTAVGVEGDASLDFQGAQEDRDGYTEAPHHKGVEAEEATSTLGEDDGAHHAGVYEQTLDDDPHYCPRFRCGLCRGENYGWDFKEAKQRTRHDEQM